MLRIAADVNMDSVMNNGMSWGEKLADGGRMAVCRRKCAGRCSPKNADRSADKSFCLPVLRRLNQLYLPDWASLRKIGSVTNQYPED